MIPSRPTTTCSPKRTGTGTCSWIRPGRSSRGRLAATPHPPHPRVPNPLCPPHSWAPDWKPVPGAQERRRGQRGHCELGYWVTGTGRKRGATLPCSPRTASPCAGRWPRRRAGRLGAGGPGHPAAAETMPAWAGRGGGAQEAGAETWAPWLLTRDRFSPSFPSSWRLHMACGGSALPGPPLGLCTVGARCPALCVPSRVGRHRSGCRRVWRPLRYLPGSGRAGVRLGPRKSGAVRGLPGPCGGGVRTVNRFIA